MSQYIKVFFLFIVLVFAWLFFGNFTANAVSTDLTKPDFVIYVTTITPGDDTLVESDIGSKNAVNSILGQVINILLIVMGSGALLTMSIGAGYMIFAMGNEENLGKGKGIFTSGLLALAIALSSYLIVAFVRYILYSNLG